MGDDRGEQERFDANFEESLEDPLEDPLFDDVEETVSKTPIIERKELLTVGFVPNEDRIVGRSDEMDAIAEVVKPGVVGGNPNNALIYGKTGTGKSLVCRAVSRRARRNAQARGTRLESVYIDCSQDDTETQVTASLGQKFNDEDETGISIPYPGYGTSKYYDLLWEVLDHYEAAIIILDEVDKLPDDNILMQLSRAEENQKTDCHIGILAISNKIEYRNRLNERVKSSLSEEQFVFHPYDANQLREIMYNREDAFHDGVLDDNTIPLAAALAAQEHGDARKAIEILRHAGELAQRNGDDHVGEKHVRQAKEAAEVDLFRELVAGETIQEKAVLYALALLVENNRDDAFPTSKIYEKYERVCEVLDGNVLTHQRVYEILQRFEFLGITTNDSTGGGRGRGHFLVHKLTRDPDVVKRAILSDDRFRSAFE